MLPSFTKKLPETVTSYFISRDDYLGKKITIFLDAIPKSRTNFTFTVTRKRFGHFFFLNIKLGCVACFTNDFMHLTNR